MSDEHNVDWKTADARKELLGKASERPYEDCDAAILLGEFQEALPQLLGYIEEMEEQLSTEEELNCHELMKGVNSNETISRQAAEIERLKAENERLRQDARDLKSESTSF